MRPAARWAQADEASGRPTTSPRSGCKAPQFAPRHAAYARALKCFVGKPCPMLHAFVSLKAGATTSAEELKQFCAQRLADYKVPESFTLLTTPLPRNANGKLLKRALREQLNA